jgi:glucose dehydrogenase
MMPARLRAQTGTKNGEWRTYGGDQGSTRYAPLDQINAGNFDERIFMVTMGYELVALNAKTGVPISSFGQNGIIVLKQNDDQVLDLITGEIGSNAGPTRASRLRTLKTSAGSLREMPVSRSCGGGHELES